MSKTVVVVIDVDQCVDGVVGIDGKVGDVGEVVAIDDVVADVVVVVEWVNVSDDSTECCLKMLLGCKCRC